MAFKIEVLDRIPTYPGRVTLTPVSGQENTYDLVRADQPIQEGTPVNKALFDRKADSLSEDVTVYVSTNGSDTGGDGTSAAPFASVNAALRALPKYLNGYTATIDIAAGTYEERVRIENFSGGTLIVGNIGRSVIIRGLTIVSSSLVKLNISNITRVDAIIGTPLAISGGSNVIANSDITVDGERADVSGITVSENSTFSSASGVTVTSTKNNNYGILASNGSRVSLHTVAGGGNGTGLSAETGAVISYGTRTMTATTAVRTLYGGRIVSGAQTDVPNY